jgi:hypothetical protein
MCKLFSVVVMFILVSGDVFAWGNDSVGPPKHRFAVSVQAGQPNKLLGVERMSLDGLPDDPQGELSRYSYGTGVTFRYFTDETFFLHLRFAYSAQHQEIYDSITSSTDDYVFNNVHETHQVDRVLFDNYNVRNILFGIGGGHESQYGRFVVRAGAEIGFIKYTQNRHYTVQGYYDRADHDSLANGNQYHYDSFIGVSTDYRYPLAWGIGLSGHATLQYKVSDHFGIGASLYLGAFYSGSRASWDWTFGDLDRITDSNGVNNNTDLYTEHTEEYSTRQFDFSPLNGQISVEYYFGH